MPGRCRSRPTRGCGCRVRVGCNAGEHERAGTAGAEVAKRERNARERRARGRPERRSASKRVPGEASGRRNTMNQPIAPAMTATAVPASSAFAMKRNMNSARRSASGFQARPWKIASMVMTVSVHERRLRLPDDHKPAVAGMQHLDRRAVERLSVSVAITSPGVPATAVRPAK